MALITPPVGINLFVIQGIAPKGTTLEDVSIGAAPFVGLLWVFLGLLIAFPEIVMFLPNLMR
jgi:C4-dicarboxylate transporter DctM subunit